MATDSATRQIIVAGVTAAVTTTIAVLLTSYLTKKSTTENIASGKQPLPQNATPTTEGSKPIVATPQSQPQPPPQAPAPAPQIDIAKISQIANAVSTALPKQPCPPGYHSVPTGQPNFPYMCIQD